MGSLHSNEQFSDSLSSELSRLALSECEHCALDEVELLLEIVEADACIDLVPVQHFRLIRNLRVWSVVHALQAAVDILVVQDVEHLLEQETIAEVHGEVLDLPTATHCKDLI